MKNDPIEAIQTAGLTIPPCPQVLIDIQQALQDPDSDNQVIARLIGRAVWPERWWIAARYGRPVGRVEHLWGLVRRGEV